MFVTGRGLVKKTKTGGQRNSVSKMSLSRNVSPNHLELLWMQKHQQDCGKGYTQEDQGGSRRRRSKEGVCQAGSQEQRHLEARGQEGSHLKRDQSPEDQCLEASDYK